MSTSSDQKYCGFCRLPIVGESDLHKGMNRCTSCGATMSAGPVPLPKTFPFQKPAPVDAKNVTTNPTLPGFDAGESLGIVRGIAVRSRGMLPEALAGLKRIVGGDITQFEKLCEDTRQAAFDRMRQHAADLGATAVTGMRFDANELTDGVTEVLCYGTAVKAKAAGGGCD